MRKKKVKTFGVVLAGGYGARLWPVSRNKRPKHLLNLTSQKSLVQETVDRLSEVVDEVFIISEASHANELKRQLSNLPEENIIFEPGRRGTASCIGLAAVYLKKMREEGVAISVPADHFIPEKESFISVLKSALKAAEDSGKLVTIGIKPTYPSTGFGYIKCARVQKESQTKLYCVEQFVEKPDKKTAQKYLDSGKFLWNAGIFVWRVSVILSEIEKHMPELFTNLREIEKYLNTSDFDSLNEKYLSLKSETIDYGIAEKSDNLAVVPGDFSWNDIGSWADLHDVLKQDKDGNIFRGHYIDIDSHNCFIYSTPEKLIATIGLDNMIIVETGDTILICPKDRTQDVKKLVGKLRKLKKEEYL